MAFRESKGRDPQQSGLPVHRGDRFGRSLMTLRNEMNQLFQDMFGETTWPASFGGPSFPAIDVVENENGFKVKADLHGMGPEDVHVTVSEGVLTIHGERREEKEEGAEAENFLRREISYGSFSRTVALPESADIDDAQASFENGMLVVEVPKRSEYAGRPRRLEINRRSGEKSRAKH